MTSIFQPRQGDRCVWVSESRFNRLDQAMSLTPVAFDYILRSYKLLEETLIEANIQFAVIGGLAVTLLGGRQHGGALATQDIDLNVNATARSLFGILRTKD